MTKIFNFKYCFKRLLKKLNKNIDNIPNYLKELIDRRWEQIPNTKESLDGSTKLLQTKLQEIEEEFKNLISIFSKDLKDGMHKKY